MFAVVLNYLLSLALVLLVFLLAWGAAHLAAPKTRNLDRNASRPFLFLAATAALLMAGVGEVGMTHTWSSDSVAARLDQGVFLALVVVGAFLLALGYLLDRPAK